MTPRESAACAAISAERVLAVVANETRACDADLDAEAWQRVARLLDEARFAAERAQTALRAAAAECSRQRSEP